MYVTRSIIKAIDVQKWKKKQLVNCKTKKRGKTEVEIGEPTSSKIDPTLAATAKTDMTR